MAAKQNVILAGIILAFFLFFCVITNVFGLTSHMGRGDAAYTWATRISFWVIVAIMYGYATKVEKQKFLLWKEEKQKVLFFIAAAICIILAAVVLAIGIATIEKMIGYKGDNTKLNAMLALMCGNKGLLVFTCLTAAFVEELIFRGYLLPRLSLLLHNKWASILLSSLLFGLAHFGFGDFNRMLFPFLIGIVFSFYYYQYRSLSVLIVCHFLMDFYSLIGGCR